MFLKKNLSAAFTPVAFQHLMHIKEFPPIQDLEKNDSKFPDADSVAERLTDLPPSTAETWARVVALSLCPALSWGALQKSKTVSLYYTQNKANGKYCNNST